MPGQYEAYLEQQEEQELRSLIKNRVQDGQLDSPADGVARAWLGGKSLSEKQQFVLDKYVLEPVQEVTCSVCDEALSVSEQLYSLDETCSDCNYLSDQINKDD